MVRKHEDEADLIPLARSLCKADSMKGAFE